MISQPLRHTAMLAALLLIAAGPAAAQDGGGELSPSRMPGWSFTPGVTLGTVWDSNVALVDAPADTQTTPSDRLMLVSPSAQLEFFSPRTGFNAAYHGALRRYMEFDQLNGFDQRANLSLRRLVTRRLTFSLAEDFAHVPTTDQVELVGVPFARTGSRINGFTGNVEARLTKYTDLSVLYENTWVKFDRTDTLLTGGTVNGGRAHLSHHLNQMVSLGAEYGTRYADLNEGTHQVSFQDVGATMNLKPSPRVTVALAGGAAYMNDRSIGLTRTGPYVRADVMRDVERATYGVAYERSFVPSFGFGGSNSSQQLRTYIRMPVYRNRAYVQGSAAWRRTDPFLATELLLDTVWIRSTVGYSVSRWLRTEGYYAYTRQDSQVTGGEIGRNRAGVQLVISQPMRIY